MRTRRQARARTPPAETLRANDHVVTHCSGGRVRVIRAIYANPGITRLGIWKATGGMTSPLPRENSSEADLFRMLIHDLSTGRVMRQQRDVSHDGRFLKKEPAPRGTRAATPYMTSSFEDEEPYELSELGAEFVHYVLSDAVKRIG